MYEKLKNYALVICLFVFLFLTLGNGLHLTPGEGFIDAVCGTALVIFAFNCWRNSQHRNEMRREEASSKIVSLRERS